MPILPYAGAGARAQQTAAAANSRRRFRIAGLVLFTTGLVFLLYMRPKEASSLMAAGYSSVAAVNPGGMFGSGDDTVEDVIGRAAIPRPSVPSIPSGESLSTSSDRDSPTTVDDSTDNATAEPTVSPSPLPTASPAASPNEDIARSLSPSTPSTAPVTPSEAPKEPSNKEDDAPQASNSPSPGPTESAKASLAPSSADSPAEPVIHDAVKQIRSPSEIEDTKLVGDAVKQPLEDIPAGQDSVAENVNVEKVDKLTEKQPVQDEISPDTTVRNSEENKPAAALAIDESEKQQTDTAPVKPAEER
jgi:hypothetical protein